MVEFGSRESCKRVLARSKGIVKVSAIADPTTLEAQRVVGVDAVVMMGVGGWRELRIVGKQS